MIADILLTILALVGLTIASIVDLKKREIPNWTNFSMIAIALAIRLMHSSLTSEWFYFLYGILGFIIMLITGNLMYYTGQWGGGDSKLLFALGAIYGTKPYFLKDFPAPFLIILFIAILFTGAIYSLIYSLVLAIKNRKEFIKELININKKLRRLRLTITIPSILIIILSLLFLSKETAIPLAAFAAMLIIITYWIIYAKAVETACLVKTISISKLTEGDWIVDKDIKTRFKIVKTGVTLTQIVKLKEENIKQVTIKNGVPFAPSFLIALIIILII
ncbi:MAG: A24 family peptidase [Candidatus Nanoarchaeia archaeon]|nr:A24 family peptidase [Candidatus Nanoarchaeia archaeon]